LEEVNYRSPGDSQESQDEEEKATVFPSSNEQNKCGGGAAQEVEESF
jgi:hypothetical protein